MNTKNILLSHLEANRNSLRSRDGLTIENVAEEAELTRNIVERDLEAARMNLCSDIVKEILDALDRVEEGVYGICIDCEEPIAERRLVALPWAKRCLKCQEAADRRSTTGYEHSIAA
ncbi:TraR/DksA family transcriptional regulator [Bryobacter aggregatus]|uniref:TraR/DksA family transcriptional regulator n=1 Tax=Bryobacter aggregatus TaxID=360054 RepID=UPI000692260A|nr:TraR/DksA family transcriptional regulator [Bryobacter aggregatus]